MAGWERDLKALQILERSTALRARPSLEKMRAAETSTPALGPSPATAGRLHTHPHGHVALGGGHVNCQMGPVIRTSPPWVPVKMGTDAAALEGPACSPRFLGYLFIHFSCLQRMMGESVKMGN